MLTPTGIVHEFRPYNIFDYDQIPDCHVFHMRKDGKHNYVAVLEEDFHNDPVKKWDEICEVLFASLRTK